jgi:hypothetical protein
VPNALPISLQAEEMNWSKARDRGLGLRHVHCYCGVRDCSSRKGHSNHPII